jgi:regulator of protease activity HflC (stomatin/prohibitin superfamily)
MTIASIVLSIIGLFIVYVILRSVYSIGPTQIGLVTKKLGKKLPDDSPIAMNGEAGHQADLLMPGLRLKVWPIYSVRKFPWVQIPAGEIGVVVAQVGVALPIGAKSAVYKPSFGNFSNVRTFMAEGGGKGVQRPVLAPGTLAPIHPVGFLVVTPNRVFGLPVTPELNVRNIGPNTFGLTADQLRITVIAPQGNTDVIGIVTTFEGDPLPAGDIANRLGGFADIDALEQQAKTDSELLEALLDSKNNLHNNFQDFQLFVDNGGKIGLQHDPLLYGAYLLNPFLVSVELVPMLVVNQGEVAVIKSYVGLPTFDVSGKEFKFGSIVRPGHRGIWQEPLRTGKYPINPRCYAAEIVPTSILTLNWAKAVSQAHNLDAQLSPIDGKSREGFEFRIDLQVQIHVPDTRAPKVISMVGTMQNLVNEVLQSAVGNHFRNTLQRLEAVRFIETRDEVQATALQAIGVYLEAYEVETRGVYIQDVVFPTELVSVLTTREIANQERVTFGEQQRAQITRIELEKARGTADMQAQLATAQVSIDIRAAEADAKTAEARGQASFIELTAKAEAGKIEAVGLANARTTEFMGLAEAKKTEAVGLAEGTATQAIGLAKAKGAEALGLAQAEGYEAQVRALGSTPTAIVAVAQAVKDGNIDLMPDVLVTGGNGVEGLIGTLLSKLNKPKPDGSSDVSIVPDNQIEAVKTPQS